MTTDLKSIDTTTLWHPFTQMAAYAEEKAPIIERGEGIYLFDTEGKKYFDGVSSLWCNVHGHQHPIIDAAIREQLGKIAHSTLLGLGSVPSIELAAELSRRSGLEHVFYAESGAAAVEIALKVAFQFKRRSKFLALRNSYHGDTLGAVSVGGIELFHGIFKPLLFEAIFADLDDFDTKMRTHADELAAVIIEPMVQGAAGMLLQPPGFVRKVRATSRELGILMIADEVATGFGRTGKMFAIEHEGVRPDVLVLGKGITAGYLPLSAALFSSEIYNSFLGRHEEFKHFLHGHTYTGNALACAAALASLRVFDEEKTLQHLPEKIARITSALEPLKKHSSVKEIRQCGMMFGIEISGYQPADRIGHQVILEARRRGLIIRPLGDVIVLMPPLSSTLTELDEMCAILREAISCQLSAVSQNSDR